MHRLVFLPGVGADPAFWRPLGERLRAIDWRANHRLQHPDAAPWVSALLDDLTADLAGVRQPTLLIWGDVDPISPVAVGEHLAARLPEATLKVLPGGDHGLVETRAAEIAPWVAAHLA